jgi:hypothetical protein
MKKLIFLSLLIFLIKPASAQTVLTVKGRTVGQNLEELEGVTILNIRSSEKTLSDKRGIFRINATKGDTLIFTFTRYSRDSRIIRKLSENVNVIMINRKTLELPPNYTVSEYKNYLPLHEEDEKLYKILEKGAVRAGLWNY